MRLVAVMLLGLIGCSPVPQFDGRQAYRYLLTQTAMGPRNPGSKGHTACRAYLIEELSRLADTLIVQDFEAENLPGTLTNLIARFNPQVENRMILCAHWDTRPWADLDPDPANRTTPIPGANDGASGVAVLLELARVFSSRTPQKGVDIALFDGEDSGEQGRPETFCLGSAYYAKHMLRPRAAYGVLVDMVGDADLDIYVEENSMAHARHVVELIWNCAKGNTSFHGHLKHSVYDDHMNLIGAGVPCAVIIDFDYPYWHTLEDTHDKCSSRSLKAVGDVLLRIVYRYTPQN